MTLQDFWGLVGISERSIAQLTRDAARIRREYANAAEAQPGASAADNLVGAKLIDTNPECYTKILAAARARYLPPVAAPLPSPASENSGDSRERQREKQEQQQQQDSHQQEWFATRPNFLEHLNVLFARAAAYEVDPRAIDARVRDEKRAWYLAAVRIIVVDLLLPAGATEHYQQYHFRPSRSSRSSRQRQRVGAAAAAPPLPTCEALREKLDAAAAGAPGHPAPPLEDLVREVGELLEQGWLATTEIGSVRGSKSKVAADSVDVDGQEKLLPSSSSEKTNPAAKALSDLEVILASIPPGPDAPKRRQQVLQNAVMQDTAGGPRGGEKMRRYKKYLDMLPPAGAGAADEAALEKVVTCILQDAQSRAGAMLDKKAAHARSRLEELRRGRTAHERKKAARRRKKAAGRADKGGMPDAAAAAATKPLGNEWYKLPRCAAEGCRKMPKTTDFICCAVCAVLAGPETPRFPTVWCSVACQQRSLASHMAANHSCTAGPHCVQLCNEDVEMRDATATTPPFVFCSMCSGVAVLPENPPGPPLSLQRPPRMWRPWAMWCSARCASADMYDHHELKHDEVEQVKGFPHGYLRYRLDTIMAFEFGPVLGLAPKGPRRLSIGLMERMQLIVSYDEALQNWEASSGIRLR